VFKSLKVSLLLVCLALLGLAVLPAYPQTETASVKLRPAEVEPARKLLGESPAGQRADPSQRASLKGGTAGEGGGGTMTLSVPKLHLEDIPVPTADSQVALDREGIIRLEDTGAPWEEGSNTFIVGHALGFLWTRTTYVFYELDKLKPGDEIIVKDQADQEYTFKVYDRMIVKPDDYWVTYPVPDKTVISLQTCTPIPTFENRLIIRGELEES
jgi:sortase A